MKDNKDVALEFVRAFANADLDSLRQILAPDLKFRGPLLKADRAETYLASLDDGALVPADVRILHISSASDSVSIFYEYVKPEGVLTVAQLFRFRAGQVAETLVVFDRPNGTG